MTQDQTHNAPKVKRMVILAHSYKNGGRCIAGREVILQSDGRVSSGSWLRPVSNIGGGELYPAHYRLQHGGELRLLDIVDVPCLEKEDNPSQPENWLVSMEHPWSRVGGLSVADLDGLVEEPRLLWHEPGGRSDRVSTGYLAAHPPAQSLYLLKLAQCYAVKDSPGYSGSDHAPKHQRYRLWFVWGGIEYRLSITDPTFDERYATRFADQSELLLKNVVVCVSLGAPFQGYHYKLVASVTQTCAGRPLFTIGHSNISAGAFVDLLKKHAITAVADVRSRPYSTYSPHFSRDDYYADKKDDEGDHVVRIQHDGLRTTLKKEDIEYVFLGRELGARRDEPYCYVDGQAKYELIAKTPAFQSGLQRIANGSARYRIALMCAEEDPLMCHRAILICRHLQNFGFDIQHIRGDGSLLSHAKAESDLVDHVKAEMVKAMGGEPGQEVLPGLYSMVDIGIDDAYRIRGDNIAFQKKEALDETLHNRVYPEER